MGCLRIVLTNRPEEQRDFYNDKARNGSLIIQPGRALVLFYRVLINCGDAAEAKVVGPDERYVRDRL